MFFLLIAASVGLRFWTFFPLVIDHDESTYIIIANQWLQGQIPYIDLVEVKPIGIFILFSLILKCHNAVWMVRLIGAMAIGATGYLLAQSANQFFKNRHGIYTGLLYVFLASLHKWSWPANTELFFLFFSVWGLLLLIQNQHKYTHFLAGLIFGLGLLFKYHILFDIAAFTLFFVLLNHGPITTKIKALLQLLTGLMIPLSLWIGYYSYLGHLPSLIFAVWTIPSRYVSSFDGLETLSFIGEFYLSFLPISILFFAGIAESYRHKQWRTLRLCLIWLAFTWIGIIATGKHYFHYLFQALPCLCFFTLNFYQRLKLPSSQFHKWMTRNGVLYLTVLIFFLVPNLNQFLAWKNSPRYLKEAAEIIKKNLETDDFIYTNHQNLLYYLTNANIPTKFVHTSLLYKPDLAHAFGIDARAEMEGIIAKKPKYYLFREDVPSIFMEEIKLHYIRTALLDELTTLYEIKHPDTK